MPAAVCRRDPHRKLYATVILGIGGHIGIIHTRHRLAQNIAQLHLRPGASALYIGKHPIQPVDAFRYPGGQLLHFAQALVHALQLLGHSLERGIQPGVQGAGQFFVHRLTHLVQLLLIALLHLGHKGTQPPGLAVALVLDQLQQLHLLTVVILPQSLHCRFQPLYLGTALIVLGLQLPRQQLRLVPCIPTAAAQQQNEDRHLQHKKHRK